MSTVLVQVRSYGGEYKARAGSGKASKTASCTMCAEAAAQRAAAKFFGLPFDCNASAPEIPLTVLSESCATGNQLFRAEFSESSSASVPSVVNSSERSAQCLAI